MILQSPSPVRGARAAVAVVFFVNGTVLASWVSQIPSVKARHGLGDDQLGLVLLSMAAGSVLALPIAGWLIARYGSRVVTTAAAVSFCITLPLPVLVPDLVPLVLALAWFGASNAVLDVSMNAQAVAVEYRYDRPIMSSFHALFSAGGLAGAAAASATMAAELATRSHVTGVALIAAALVTIAVPRLLPSLPTGQIMPVFSRPPMRLLALGTLTFCGLLAEGAIGDWSAVYLHDALGASPATAAGGFAAFSLAMAAGRFGGDQLTGRVGPGALLRMSAATAALGLTGALIIGSPSVAIVGFALVGFGIANVIPLLFSAAGRVPGLAPGTALAGIATTGYGGYLTGPPLIGLVASQVGLSIALGIVVAACAVIAASARWLPSAATTPRAHTSR